MHKRTGSILLHEIENVTEKTFDFCEALCRISISRYIGQCPVRCSPGLQTIKMLALSWHIVSGIQTPAPTIRAPKLQCRNNGWALKWYCILIFTAPLPVTEPFIGKGWARAGPTAHCSRNKTRHKTSSLLFTLLKHGTMTRLFVTIIGHTGAGMQSGLPLLLSINSGVRREGGREGSTKGWPRNELNIVKLVTRHWASPHHRSPISSKNVTRCNKN